MPGFTAPFTPCVEIGWRLAAAHWGRGYATEAARAVLVHAWDVVGLDEVVSFTTAGNDRSRAVMVRLGMRYDPGDDFTTRDCRRDTRCGGTCSTVSRTHDAV